MGEFATECTWDTIILLPKGGGNYHYIGMVEVIREVISIIINRRLEDSIEFHNGLHELRERRGTGTSTLEAKILNQIVVMHQAVLYKIFLDIQKAYDVMYKGRALSILEGYGGGPQVC